MPRDLKGFFGVIQRIRGLFRRRSAIFAAHYLPGDRNSAETVDDANGRA
jgi:hypothetical protein